MITPENLNEVLNKISPSELTAAMDSTDDYVCLQVYIFNTGYHVEFNPIDTLLCNDAEEIQNNGGLICDKDAFLQLVKDSETTNKHLLELI